jgi:lipopolysaccharide export system permease protein
MWDVQIFDVSDPARIQSVFADSGVAAFAAGGTDMVLQLYDGHTREASTTEPGTFRRIYFDRQVLGIPGVANQLVRTDQPEGSRGYREMTVGMLLAQIDTLRGQRSEEARRLSGWAAADLRMALGQPEPAADSAEGDARQPPPAIAAETDPRTRTRRTADLLENGQRQLEFIDEQIRNYDVEIHKKYSIAMASLVFVILGAPLALRFGAGGVGMVIATSMAVFSLYYVGLIGGESLAGRGIVTPIFAMWVINALMLVLGVIGLATMGRESSTARSSAWEAALQRLGGLRSPFGRLRGSRR